jgi:hypothetical protein
MSPGAQPTLVAGIAVVVAAAAVLTCGSAGAEPRVAVFGLGGPESERAAHIAGLAVTRLETIGYTAVEPEREVVALVYKRTKPTQAVLRELVRRLDVEFVMTVRVSREVEDEERFLRLTLMLIDEQGMSLTEEQREPLEQFDQSHDRYGRAVTLMLARAVAAQQITFPKETARAAGTFGAALGVQGLTYVWMFYLAEANRGCDRCITAGMAAHFVGTPVIATSLAWLVASRARYHTAPYVPMLLGAYLGAGLGFLSVYAVLGGWTNDGSGLADVFLVTIPPVLAPPVLLLASYLMFRELKPQHGTGAMASVPAERRVVWYPPVPAPIVSMDGSGRTAPGLSLRAAF